MKGSERFRYNLEDLKRISRTFVISLISAFLTSALVALPEFQQWAISVVEQNADVAPTIVPLITGLIIVIFDALRRLITDYNVKK